MMDVQKKYVTRGVTLLPTIMWLYWLWCFVVQDTALEIEPKDSVFSDCERKNDKL